MEEYLPLGSVVQLKKATKPVIIIGYMVVENDHPDKVWDYLACPYPIGVVDMDKNFIFQKEQIDKVIFKGYTDVEGESFLTALKDLDKMQKPVEKND